MSKEKSHISKNRFRVALTKLKNWMFAPLNYGGLVGAVVFFALTMTPTLIPRSWQLQGLLAGLTAAIGYGLGSFILKIVRGYVSKIEPDELKKKRLWQVLYIAGPILVIASVLAGEHWDKQLRQLMTMDYREPWQVVTMVILSVVFAVILIGVGRGVKGFFHFLDLLAKKIMPPKVAKIVGFSLAAGFVIYVILGGLAQNIFSAIDYAASIKNDTVQTDLAIPTTPLRSGSPESYISWEQLGAKGREFIAGGPSVDEINSFSNRKTAVEPIRIYGGLRYADTLDERIDLILKELERTDAYARKAIFIQTPSGNGEIPPVNADAPEYILDGDTAQVALQYSYAPSATTMLTNPGVGNEAGEKIVNAIVEKVNSLPENSRPKVFVAGESLGSSSTEAAFESASDMVDKVNGVVMVGPTFFNKIREELIDSRDESSPVWLPIIDEGKNFRFAREPANLYLPDTEWQDKRIVYLANSSDPVGWFSVRTLYSRPEFLNDPRGPDVSPSMHWIPVVTFWQQLLDLQFASGAPSGHGHRYGLNVVDGWAGVINPDGWTGQQTQRLREYLQPVLDEYLNPEKGE